MAAIFYPFEKSGSFVVTSSLLEIGTTRVGRRTGESLTSYTNPCRFVERVGHAS